MDFCCRADFCTVFSCRAGNRYSANLIVQILVETRESDKQIKKKNRAGNRYSAHHTMELRSALAHAARMSESLRCYWWRCFHYR